MADNLAQYGFRPFSRRTSAPPVLRSVATGQDDRDDAAASVGINIGDPVTQVDTGGVIVCKTTVKPWGIVVGINAYYDGTRMVFGKALPNQTSWGSVEDRRSLLLVQPVESYNWEIDCDNATLPAGAATTRALWETVIGNNVTHVCVKVGTKATPLIDISTAATTEDLVWRIERISPTLYNKDFTGANVKIVVSCNDGMWAGMPATSIVGT